MGLTEFAFSLFIFPILIFIAVFIFERAFGSRLVRMGCTCWERVPWHESNSRDSRISPEPSAVASTYQSTKKEALEKIESMLNNFSMVLQKEDMVQRLPDVSSVEEEEYDMVDIELGDTTLQSNHDEQDETDSTTDNNNEQDTISTTDNIAELFRYTHIKIPYAGHKVGEDTDDNDNPNRREVPHFCAICLGQYELDDKVAWASNSQCTHCFHKDCVTQWWIASWKKKRRTVLHTLEEKATINCPMCRQPFMCWLEESCRASSKEKDDLTNEATLRRIGEELADY